MSRYATAGKLREFLAGNNAALQSMYDNYAYESAINQAEAQVDGYCQRQFQLHKVNEIHSGNSTFMMMLKSYPIFILNKLTVRYYPLSVVREFTDTDGQLLLNRKIGQVAIRPSFALVGGFPQEYAQYYAYIFPRGAINMNAQAVIAHAFVGDNIGMDAIGRYYYTDIAVVETVGGDVFFRCPDALGGYTPSEITDKITVAFPSTVKMLKTPAGAGLDTYTDDSANWYLVDSFTVKIAAASYDSSALYRLVYIPAAVGDATVRLAACQLLLQKGARDDKHGSGGAQSINISGISETYGDRGPYSGQIKAWSDDAFNLLRPLRKATFSITG